LMGRHYFFMLFRQSLPSAESAAQSLGLLFFDLDFINLL
jgi:hypothetical protein